MSAGMADIIAAHPGHEIRLDDQLWVQVCFGCPWRYRYSDGSGIEAHAAHAAEELAKAGYGNVQEALVAAADAMPIGTLEGADKASVWLRQRAHTNDPEGRALVQAIHNRKAQA